MRVGLTLPHYDYSLPEVSPITFEAVADEAVRAERLGFDSVWVSDHFFASLDRYGGGDERHGALEPLTTLGGLAVRTERIRLGTLVLSAAFRHPAVLAKSATAVDRLSGGRLELGLGAGWYEPEFEAFGYPFGSVGERFDLLEETLAYVGALFDGEPASFEGKRFRLQEAFNHARRCWWVARADPGCCGSPRSTRTAGTPRGVGHRRPTPNEPRPLERHVSVRDAISRRSASRSACSRWWGRTRRICGGGSN
jgi:alkanesulfonate monooxygenase SsuD/methylene tetrahydromethanopterin reductase-like flavin-dependent oxidoreductase (luciferase family)